MPKRPPRAPGAHDLNAALHVPSLRDDAPTPDRLAALEARWNRIHDADVPVPPAPTWSVAPPLPPTHAVVPASVTDAPDPRGQAIMSTWLDRGASAPPQQCDVCRAPYTAHPTTGRLEIVHRLDRHEAATRHTHDQLDGPVRVRRVGTDDEDQPARRSVDSGLARVRRALGERDED